MGAPTHSRPPRAILKSFRMAVIRPVAQPKTRAVPGSHGRNLEPRMKQSTAIINFFRPLSWRRLAMAISSLAAVLTLAACGGGGYATVPGGFNIGVTIGGQFLSATPVAPGGYLNLAIHAGQSVTLDAGEPVIWTMYVGGTAISGGAQVYYAGADITATTLDRYAVAVDTYAAYLLPASIPITLVATSTYDSAQVATVNLLITN